MKHLEPVVKKSKSFRILFLRDDSKVVSFRLKPFWLKFLGVVVVFFFGASGAAGYSAHYYWKKYHTLQRERTELTEKLGENRRELGRFAGVERIKESTLPRTTMAGVTSMTGAGEGANGKGNGNGQAQNGNQPGPQNGTAPPVDPGPQTAAASQATQPKPAGPETPVVSPPPENAAPQPQGAESPEPGEKEHPALVSEVQVRPAGNKTFKLAFDLSNRDQQLTLNGRVTLSIATKDGEKHEVTQVNRDALRFIINRYKRVNTNFVLPPDLQADDVAQLLLTVTAEDQPAITYTFPIPSPS